MAPSVFFQPVFTRGLFPSPSAHQRLWILSLPSLRLSYIRQINVFLPSQSTGKLMILAKIRPSCIIINVSFWSFSYVHLNPLLSIRIREPELFPSPGSGIRIRNLEWKIKDPGSGINITDHISENLVTSFWVKNCLLLFQFSVADLDPASGMKKSRSATLFLPFMYSYNILTPIRCGSSRHAVVTLSAGQKRNLKARNAWSAITASKKG